MVMDSGNVWNSTRGFTLIELSIVLVMMGLLTAISVSGAKVLKQSWEVQEMRLHAELALRAVDEFVAARNRLPSEKEFNKLGLPKSRNGGYVYRINPELTSLFLAEQYCEYRYDSLNKLSPNPVKNQKAVPYAYAVDFESADGVYLFRYVKEYDDLLADLRCKNTPFPVILTKTLPPVKVGSSYNANIVFQGGVTERYPNYAICISILNDNEWERSVILRYLGHTSYFSALDAPVPICSAPDNERVSGGLFNLSSENRIFTESVTSIRLRIAVRAPFVGTGAVTMRDYVINVEP